jgi:glycosyltransferase involved in cell wall biosynthesis
MSEEGSSPAEPSAGRPSVALLGPLPPPWGGYTTYTTTLRDSRLYDRYGIHCIDTGHPKPLGSEPALRRYPAMARYLARDLLRVRKATRIASIRGVHMIADYNISRFLALALQFEQVGRAGWRRAFDIRAGTFITFAAESPAWIQRILGSVLRRAEVVTVEGRVYVDYIRSRWGVESVYMPSFIDWQETGGSWHARPGATSGPLRVIYAGRVAADKGVIELVEAIIQIHRRVPIRLTIVGPREGRLRRTVDDLIASNGLHEVVRYTGNLPREDYLRTLSEGQVYAMPTYHEGEGHSNALNEAMAIGLAIVSCDQGFIKDALGPEAGILVPQRDSNALATTLEELARNPEHRQRLGDVARDRAQRLFSDEKVIEDWSRIYGELVRDR